MEELTVLEINKARKVYVGTRITSDDMAYLPIVKKSLIFHINNGLKVTNYRIIELVNKTGYEIFID